MSERISIVVLGDICPEDGFKEQFETGISENVFHDLIKITNKADLVVANLEAPLTHNCKKLKKNSCNLKGNPLDAKVLANAGIHGVALANNHILDYGIESLKDTFNILEKENIFYYGAGNSNDCSKPYFVTIKGKTIGFLAFAEHEFSSVDDYGMGANCWDDLTSPKLIADAKKYCDYLIIQYHGGIEHYIYPSPYLQKKCRIMAEMGADFITCQHSHCIGTRENWNGCEILYGQGNAIFGYVKGNEAWNTGLLVQLDISDSMEINYIPIIATPEGEMLAVPSYSEEILTNMTKESEKITDEHFVKSEWDKFCHKHADEYLPMAFAKGRIFNKLNRITKGLLIRLFTNESSRRNVMNLIRCDAHREVLQTILENDYYAN